MKIFKNNLNNNSKTIALRGGGETGKIKYLPSFSKEWKNIIYCYNQNNLKNIPVNNVNINKIIKSYFNLYFKNPNFVEGGASSLHVHIRGAASLERSTTREPASRRGGAQQQQQQQLQQLQLLEQQQDKRFILLKKRRNFLRRIYVSNAEIKHTNNKAIITLYTVNRESLILKEKYLKINKKVSKNIIKRFLLLYKKNVAALGGGEGEQASYNSNNIIMYKILRNFRARKEEEGALRRARRSASSCTTLRRGIKKISLCAPSSSKNYLNYKLKYLKKSLLDDEFSRCFAPAGKIQNIWRLALKKIWSVIISKYWNRHLKFLRKYDLMYSLNKYKFNKQIFLPILSSILKKIMAGTSSGATGRKLCEASSSAGGWSEAPPRGGALRSALKKDLFFIRATVEPYARPLATKKIEYNIINLKSIAYNTDLFTNVLALKLKKKNQINTLWNMLSILNRAYLPSVVDIKAGGVASSCCSKLANGGCFARGAASVARPALASSSLDPPPSLLRSTSLSDPSCKAVGVASLERALRRAKGPSEHFVEPKDRRAGGLELLSELLARGGEAASKQQHFVEQQQQQGSSVKMMSLSTSKLRAINRHSSESKNIGGVEDFVEVEVLRSTSTSEAPTSTTSSSSRGGSLFLSAPHKYKDLKLISILNNTVLRSRAASALVGSSLHSSAGRPASEGRGGGSTPFAKNFDKLLGDCSNTKQIHNTIYNSIGYKNMRGIRLEIKGRLTKRYRADRSIYSLKWKGGLKNVDSSFMGLSSVLFRGNSNSNVSYSVYNSKRRIGAFAVKGWIAGGYCTMAANPERTPRLATLDACSAKWKFMDDYMI